MASATHSYITRKYLMFNTVWDPTYEDISAEGELSVCSPLDEQDKKGPISTRMARYVRVCRALIESKGKIRCIRINNSWCKTESEGGTKKFLEFIQRERNRYMIDGHVTSWRREPYAELLVRHIDGADLFGEDQDWDFACMDPEDGAQQVKLLNSVISNIRSEGKSEGFRKRFSDQERRVREDERSAAALLDAHFRKRNRILVLRVDLGFDAPPSGMYDPLQNSVSHGDVWAAREELVEYLEKIFPKTLLGWVLRLEYGLDKGFHFHLLVLLNGRDHRADELLAKRIGVHWVEVITAQRGHYWNCHVHKDSFRRKGKLGIGMIRHHDWLGRRNLAHVASYLCKHDPFIEAHVPAGAPTLWISAIPKEKADRRGRPRMHETPDLIDDGRRKRLGRGPSTGAKVDRSSLAAQGDSRPGRRRGVRPPTSDDKKKKRGLIGANSRR